MWKVTTKIPEPNKESSSNTHWINSLKRKIYSLCCLLSDFASKTHRYLVAIVDDFSNMIG